MSAPQRRADVEPGLLTAALETVFAAVVVVRAERDASGRISDFTVVFANDTARQFAGPDGAAMEDRSLAELFPGVRSSGYFDRYVHVIETGEPLELEAAPYHEELDGHSKWGLFDVRADAFGDHVVIVSLDVTERQEQTHAFDNVKRLARIGMWTWDATSNDLSWSPEMYAVFGVGLDEPITTATLEERTHPDDREKTRQTVADAVVRGQPFLLEQRVVHRDGGERVVLVSGGPLLGSSGEILAVVGTSQDITDLRRLESELHTAREDLLEATLDSERADRRRIEEARRDAEQRYGQLVRRLGRSVLLARVTAEVSDLIANLDSNAEETFDRVTQLIAGALDGVAAMGIAFERLDALTPVAFADASGPRPDMLEALHGALFPTAPTAAFEELAATGDPLTASGDELFELVPPDFHPYLHRFGIRSMALVVLEARDVILGVIIVGRQSSGSFDEGDLSFLRDLGDRCGLALANWRLQRARERTARGLASLQSVTDATVEELGVDALLDEVMVRIRGALDVDTVRILLTDDGEMLRGGAQIGFSVDAADIPVRVGQGVAGRIALSREPVVFGDLADVHMVSPLLRAQGLATVAGVSLWAGDNLVGVLHVGSRHQRLFDAWDLELLARAGERIGAAVERNRLYERELEARERLEFVASVNEVLGGSLERDAIMRAVVRVTVPRLGDWCSIHVLPEVPSTAQDLVSMVPDVQIAHTDPEKVTLARELLARYPFDPSAPIGVPAVLRTGRPQLFSEFPYAELERQAPGDERLGILRDFGVHSVMVVPLQSRGRPLGAMQFVRAESGPSYTEDDLGLALSIAGRVGAALENVRLFETQRHIARTLQASLLPASIPSVPGASVAVRYWAAGEATEVGGDFYDLFSLPDGRIGVVIGDVCGKGPRAAAVTGLVRHTLRGAARHEPDPATVMRWVNESIIDAGQDRFCTAVYGVLEPRDDRVDLHVAVSGHPLPVVVDGSGRAVDVGRHGNPLGVFDEIRASTERHVLLPGDTLVLYTDGITDVPPPHDLDDSDMRELLSKAVIGTESAEEVADRIFDAVQQIKPLDRRDDDIAILVVRLDADAGALEGSFASPDELHLALTDATIAEMSEARRRVAAWLFERGLPLLAVDELALITSELLSNAFKAADRHDTELSVRIEGGEVVLEVANRADEDVSSLEPALPEPDASSGRGLFVVAALADHLDVDVEGGRVVARATKRLPG